MLGNLIGGFIVIIVGVNLAPVVANQVALITNPRIAGTTNTTNVSSAATTIVGLTTLFFALGVASAGISVAAQGLRAAGMLSI